VKIVTPSMSGDRIVDQRGKYPEQERDNDGGGNEFPGRDTCRPRHHKLVAPRQSQIAGHRTNQHAERHDAFGNDRHAEERQFENGQRGRVRIAGRTTHQLDGIEQRHEQYDAGKHGNDGHEEPHSEISPEGEWHAHRSASVMWPVRPIARAARAALRSR
jgi:hypothetical protein